MANNIDDFLAEAQHDLRFDRDNLDQAWSEQAMHYAVYSHKLHQAENIASKLKNQLDELTAKLYAVEKREFSMSGIKPTESMILNKIKTNPSYQRAKSGADNARNDADLHKNILECFRHRRDMIVQASKRELFDLEKLGDSSFIHSKK